MPLSDLEQAREAAARLSQRQRTSGRSSAEGAAAAPSYARLSMPRIVEPQPSFEPVLPALDVYSLEQAGQNAWGSLLDWLLASTRASSVFVVDEDGLPVAQAGAIGQDELDALGARLSFAFEQTSRMRSTQSHVDSIFIELDQGWLSAIRVAAAAGSRLVFAVLSDAPLSVSLRDRLAATLGQVLA